MKKLIILTGIMLTLLFLAGCKAPENPRNTEIAKCLTENNVVMYGTEWCPHCKDQKALFGESFKEINYVDCDKQPSICQEKGITGYPTWIINEEKITGTTSVEELAILSNCQPE